MEKEQQMVKNAIAKQSANNEMSVTGDCICDSLGHSAKYG